MNELILFFAIIALCALVGALLDREGSEGAGFGAAFGVVLGIVVVVWHMAAQHPH